MIEMEFTTRTFNLIKNTFREFYDVPVKLIITDSLQILKEGGIARLNTKIKDLNPVEHTIFICDDLFVIEKESYENDYAFLLDTNVEFLNSLNIEISHKALIVSMLLHEFGHLSQIIKFMKSSNIKDLSSLERINTEFIYVIRRMNKEKAKSNKYEDSLYYTLMFTDLYAEMFKFKYFYKIWNLIRLREGNS